MATLFYVIDLRQHFHSHTELVTYACWTRLRRRMTSWQWCQWAVMTSKAVDGENVVEVAVAASATWAIAARTSLSFSRHHTRSHEDTDGHWRPVQQSSATPIQVVMTPQLQRQQRQLIREQSACRVRLLVSTSNRLLLLKFVYRKTAAWRSTSSVLACIQ